VPFSDALVRSIATLAVVATALVVVPKAVVETGHALWTWEDGVPTTVAHGHSHLDVLRICLLASMSGLAASLVVSLIQSRGSRRSADETTARGERLARITIAVMVGIAALSTLYLWSRGHAADAAALGADALRASGVVLATTVSGALLLGGLDRILGRAAFMKRHRMSSEELKREFEESALPESVRKERRAQRERVGLNERPVRFRRWVCGESIAVLVVWDDALGASPRIAELRLGGSAHGLSRRAGDRSDAQAPALARELGALGVGQAVPRRLWRRLV